MSRLPDKDTVEERDRTVTLTNHTINIDNNTLTTTSSAYGRVPSYNTSSSKFDDDTEVWNDLIGYVENPSAGGSSPPNYTLFKTIHYAWSMRNTGDTHIHFKYHPNHDTKTDGTTIYDFHLHFATNATAETGTVVFTPVVAVGKRDGTFTSDVTLANVSYTFQGASDQYKHQVVEVNMARVGGGTNLIDSADIDIDSMILIHLNYDDTLSTVAHNTSIFVFQADLHYLCPSKVGTKNNSFPWDT